MSLRVCVTEQLPTDPSEKGEVLRHAHIATLIHTPVSIQAKQLEQILTDLTIEAEADLDLRKRKRNANAQYSLRSTISAFVADLVIASENELSLGFCYRPKDRADFSQTLASDRQFNHVEEIWTDLSFIEVVDGFRGKDDWLGHEIMGKRFSTRYRATLKLLDHATALGITAAIISEHYEQDRSKLRPILLRGNKTNHSQGASGQMQHARGKIRGAGEQIKFRLNGQTKGLIAEVKEINGFLNRFEFNLPDPPFLRRVFNNGTKTNYKWDQGGRFYSLGAGGYQQLPKESRLQITIDGDCIVELDIRASHLTILYAKAGKELRGDDPYAIAGIPREVVKYLVTAIIGKGGVPSRWNGDLTADYIAREGRKLNKDFPLKKTAQRVLAIHPLIDLLNASGLDTYRLQFIEAEVLKSAMLRLLRQHEAPSLPVHDSLIVRERDKDQAEAILKEEFKKQIGVTPTISMKRKQTSSDLAA